MLDSFGMSLDITQRGGLTPEWPALQELIKKESETCLAEESFNAAPESCDLFCTRDGEEPLWTDEGVSSLSVEYITPKNNF